MKNLFVAFFFLLGTLNVLALEPADEFTATIMEYGGANGNAAKFEKLELGVHLPSVLARRFDAFPGVPESLNPYDPDVVNIEATFKGPNGEEQKVFGFYYEDYSRVANTRWEKKVGTDKFRVRFAPDQIGEWEVNVLATINGKSYTAATVRFTCKDSDQGGFVVRSHHGDERDRYLKYSGSGETFFLVGENMVWAEQGLKPFHHNQYIEWMNQLANNGGNFIRLGMISFAYGVEWEALGDYGSRQSNAWELDQLMNLAHQKGIHFDMLMNIHDSYRPPAWAGHLWNWNNNPYQKGIESVTDPIHFFTDPEAKKYFKRRLRYIVSRWGYSTNVVMWELFSELDKAIGNYHDNSAVRLQVNDWVEEMKNYIRLDLGDTRHLVGASYSIREEVKYEEKVFRVSDITFNHDYGRDEDQNYNQRYQDTHFFLNHPLTLNQPVLLQEMGGTVYATLDLATDLPLHNGIWATSMSGNCGTGLNWWWDFAVHKKGSYTNFLALSQFMEGVPLGSEVHTSEQWRNREVENFSLVNTDQKSAIGWVHNRSYWWANEYSTNPAVKRLIDDNNGFSNDQIDNTRYGEWRDDDKFTPLPAAKFKIKGLGGSLFKKPTYKVTFYTTRGEAVEVSSTTGKVNAFGSLQVVAPPMQGENGDFGYKVELVER